MIPKNFCPVCNSKNLFTFLKHKHVPVHQNLPMPDKISAQNISRGDLTLCFCKNCTFIFNKTFDLNLLKYGKGYDNTQDISSSFQNHISKLIDKLINEKNIQNKSIIEVGCGQGSFLKKLIIVKDCNNIGYGFDPSYIGEENLSDGRLKFFKKFYDSDCLDISADIVISRHVIEHVPDPVSLLKTIHKALSNSNAPRVFFETPTVDWILTNQVIWDFFYEHCSYFNPQSLSIAFENAGFTVENIDIIFGKQYMLLEAKPSKNPSFNHTNSISIEKLVKRFQNYETKHTHDWINKISVMNKNGNVAVWGAGAKGVTFVNTVDPLCTSINCVIDVNPNKQTKFVPGTGHLIISPKDIDSRKISNIILMNPNYYDEIKKILDAQNLKINLIT